MSRTAKYMKALVEKAHATKRVADMLYYESGTHVFEAREKVVLDDLFVAITKRANQGFTYLTCTEEPALKRIEIKAYLVKKGFTFDSNAVHWDTSTSSTNQLK
jgi:hypothetical protein